MVGIESLVLDLFKVGAVKCGEFKLKSGLVTPIYFDLRVIISYPDLIDHIAELLYEKCKLIGFPARICGVPYTALPIATLVSSKSKIPMVLRRKEAKEYGTMKLVEGNFEKGDSCVVVEDVVTSGSSILETVKVLENVGLVVKDTIVVLDRDQGGITNVEKNGIKFHCLLSLSYVMEVLVKHQKITNEFSNKVLCFISDNQTVPKLDKDEILDFESRAEKATHPVSKKLFNIISSKKSNLCLSADVETADELLTAADNLGPYICALKTHVDALDKWNDETIFALKNLSQKHQFLIFEDRKFADLGHTVKRQFGSKIFKTNQWADIINAHSIPGPGVLQGLKLANQSSGCLLIAEMSSDGNLISQQYIKDTLKIAKEHKDFVIGFICQRRIICNPNFVHFVPGVHNKASGDNLTQKYQSVKDVIINNKADVVIVGRAILESEEPLASAIQYSTEAYQAYKHLIGT